MAGDSVPATDPALHAESIPKHSRTDSRLLNIIDIRQDREYFNLVRDIKDGLRPSNGGSKSLPTLLLYDEEGLKLFEKITYLEQYYLTNAEIEVLKTWAASIAERISPGSIVLELGSGNLRKIRILLDAFEAARKPVEYYALDVSLQELERTLAEVPIGSFEYVKCFGLHGTYDDGAIWIESEQIRSKPKAVLSMGSSIGNFTRTGGSDFLKQFAKSLQPGDALLVGMDGCKNPAKVYPAYNDRELVTRDFILNGLVHANRLLRTNAFNVHDWEYHGQYEVGNDRHHAFVMPKKDVIIDGVTIKAGEKLEIEESNKFDALDIARIWENAGLIEGAKWMNASGNYGLHMAYKPDFNFSLIPQKYAASPVPSLDEWRNLWAAWDQVTQQMIPKDELLAKPIKLRNACIFYLGHIPTFLAIHLHKATSKGPEQLAEYQRIFERGIDPDVDNPELCHDHSEIPDEWPAEKEILAFQAQVRDQVEQIYKQNVPDDDHAVAQALWIGFEHETLHLETLLYMLVQSEKTLPPPGAVRPDFEAIARAAQATAVENQWITIPERNVTLGLNDVENDKITRRYFGWDNEKPKRTAKVHSFQAQARPVTNGEYATYLEETGNGRLPASWSVGHSNGNGTQNGHTNGNSFYADKIVRTVFGAIPLKLALDWPVMASYDELAAFATWSGGRIPSMEEARSIYEYAEESKMKDVENSLGKTIPAVNGHLINDGVEETPPYHNSVNGASDTDERPSPHSIFVNLEGANVGFKHWHPLPVTPNGNTLAGHGEFGGVWEWTSSVLDRHDGFEPMALYPGYSADFFDGKHNIVLGGSWATHPRVAGRRSFINWYQRNYPFVWAGARLVRDV